MQPPYVAPQGGGGDVVQPPYVAPPVYENTYENINVRDENLRIIIFTTTKIDINIG